MKHNQTIMQTSFHVALTVLLLCLLQFQVLCPEPSLPVNRILSGLPSQTAQYSLPQCACASVFNDVCAWLCWGFWNLCRVSPFAGQFLNQGSSAEKTQTNREILFHLCPMLYRRPLRKAPVFWEKSWWRLFSPFTFTLQFMFLSYNMVMCLPKAWLMNRVEYLWGFVV